jgi:hypothetical protein
MNAPTTTTRNPLGADAVEKVEAMQDATVELAAELATPEPVANLAAARKEQAAAKAKHPAGKAKTPAKKVTAAGKPAEAKSPSTSSKIRWEYDSEKDEKGRRAQHGTSPVTGATYAITGSGDVWTITVTAKGSRKVEALAESVSHQKTYSTFTKHHAEAVAATKPEPQQASA